jgi:voltage-gated potassium channel
MTKMLKRASTSSLARRLKRLWPQVPLGLFLFFVGAINVLTGIQSRAFSPAFQILARATPLSELSQEISLGILGSSVQALLGAGLLLTGIGLLWRLRSAWAFSILLLVIAIVLDLFNQRDLYGALLSGLALAALLIWEKRFSRRSLLGGYLISFISLLAVLAYGVLGSLLLGGSFHPGIQDIYTALYFTVVTLSTVGSNIYPSTSEAQFFMVTLILGGISIFTTTIVTTLGPLLSNQIRPILAGKNAKKDSSDQVILVGSGPFVESLVHELTRLGIVFVQVVTPSEAPPSSEHPIVQGDSGNEDVLEQAGISSATTVVIVGDGTADKVAAAQSVKSLNPSARLVIVVDSAEALAQFNPVHADLIFLPEAAAARTLVSLLLGASVPKELRDIIELKH